MAAIYRGGAAPLLFQIVLERVEKGLRQAPCLSLTHDALNMSGVREAQTPSEGIGG